MLNRLMCGPVFAQPDAVVSENKSDGQIHDRRHANRRTHVIGEDEECAAVRTQAAMQCKPVEDAAHAMFTHAEVNVASGKIVAR